MASLLFSYIFFFSFHLYIISAHQSEPNDNTSSPLEFLNPLSGIQKGNRRVGVNELKKYLSYLGYMNCPTHPDDLTNENKFDDCLELAVKKYQKFYNLKITGVLDASTVSKMRQPRCGLPDFYPTKRTASFHMTSHYSFFPDRPIWSVKQLNYNFDPNTTAGAISSIESALNQWASASHFRFIRTSIARIFDIRIGFYYGDHGDGVPFSNELAHAFPPPDGRVHFDAAKNWSTNAARGTYDIQTVGLHELGHALGLGHSSIQAAIMYPVVNTGERKGLHGDDIEGIRVLYNL